MVGTADRRRPDRLCFVQEVANFGDNGRVRKVPVDGQATEMVGMGPVGERFVVRAHDHLETGSLQAEAQPPAPLKKSAARGALVFLRVARTYGRKDSTSLMWSGCGERLRNGPRTRRTP